MLGSVGPSLPFGGMADVVVPGGSGGKLVLAGETSSLPGGPFGDPPVPRRWLSFRGKASAINAGALSKLWHVGHVVLMHPKHVKRFKSSVFEFLWQGPDRVKRTVMVSSHLAGGPE